MVNDRVFHIYKKNTKTTEVIKHSVTTDELEQMILINRLIGSSGRSFHAILSTVLKMLRSEIKSHLKFLRDLKKDLRRNPKHKVPKHPLKYKYKHSSFKG